MDAAIVTWFSGHRSAPLDALAVFFTFAGRAGLIFIVAAVVRAFSVGQASRRSSARQASSPSSLSPAGRAPRSSSNRLAMAAWQVVLAALLALLISDVVLKPAAARPRPWVTNPALAVVGDRPASGSFPSGHAAACVATALVLGSTWRRARIGIWVIACLVAVSRVYLGVHYPTDVLGGAAVGWVAGWFALGNTAWRVDSAAAPAAGAHP